MLIRIALLALFISGCGSGGSDSGENNHGYGYAFDVQGASGLTLRYYQEAPQTPVQIFENEYNEVQQCTGLTAPAPFVIFIYNDALAEPWGFYYSAPPLITIKTWLAFKHEAVHYLLDHNTGDVDHAHSSDLFAKCSR